MASQAPVVNPDDRNWWEQLYQSSITPWDLGGCAPPLQSFLQSPYAVPPGRMVVPGCGNGHDSLFFASRGFQVTAVDFAQSAIQATMTKFEEAGLLGTNGYLLHRDFFDIHEYDHYFDYVLEHTCFCAIDPSRRKTYVRTVHDLLKKGGKLIGLWWLLDTKGGPPFGVDRSEIFGLFSDLFSIDLAFVPSDSVPARQGQELFAIMTAL